MAGLGHYRRCQRHLRGPVEVAESATCAARTRDAERPRADGKEVAGRVVYSTPKTHQTRAVPLPRFLIEELAQMVVGKDPNDHVFTRKDGQVLAP
ncbi:MAG: hypothetical protein M3070_15420 [Actinomycetota bacterium]|nr:hypothetical protein [Actinomycetota bacterium]